MCTCSEPALLVWFPGLPSIQFLITRSDCMLTLDSGEAWGWGYTTTVIISAMQSKDTEASQYSGDVPTSYTNLSLK